MSMEVLEYFKDLLASGSTWQGVNCIESGVGSGAFFYGYEEGGPLPAMYIASESWQKRRVAQRAFNCEGIFNVFLDLPSSGASFDAEYPDMMAVAEGVAAEICAQDRVEIRSVRVEAPMLAPITHGATDDGWANEAGIRPDAKHRQYWEATVTVEWG